MSGNIDERVRIPQGPVMIKGGSWNTNHPLNLRVLDLCIQPMEAAEQSVGFRCMAWARELPPADARKAPPPPPASLPAPDPLPELRLAPSLVEGLLEARERNCVLFLSLHHETCGQCDRTREQVLYDPDLSAFLNTSCVVVQGQDPWDALDRPHAPRADGQCPLFPALRCAEHEKAFVDGLNLVHRFRTSPGYFVLSGGADPEILLGEDAFPKSGDAAAGFRTCLQEAQARLGPFLNREDADAIRDAMASGDREALRARLEGKDPKIPLVSDALALLGPEPEG